MESGVPHPGVRMLHVLEEQFGHGVHVRALLYVLDRLLHGCQSGQLCLPRVLLAEPFHQREQCGAARLHCHGLYDAVDRLFAVVVQLVDILLALFVVHALRPLLEGVVAIFDLQHEVHATFQSEGGEIRQTLGEPLAFSLRIDHQPLERKAPDAFLQALTGLHEFREQLRRLHGAAKLLLEEVGLQVGGLEVILQTLLQLVLGIVSRELLQHLGQHIRRCGQRRPILFVQLADKLADQNQRTTADLCILVCQAMLHHSAQFLLALRQLVLEGRHEVLHQSDGRLAARDVAVARCVREPEHRLEEPWPPPLARGQPAPLVVLVAAGVRQLGDDLADLLLQLRVRQPLEQAQ
mmetsp:Transcript_37597/g.113566  ORF Transcript_37597/g.113566 Transcript_37597/m.113566 type:complete len:350 (-) Transcript_37597:360-1409(-)